MTIGRIEIRRQFARVANKPLASCADGFETKPYFDVCSGWRLDGCNRAVLTPKPAFSSLDRISLVPTADSWAVRSDSPVSAALAGSAGFQISALNPASAHRYVVVCGFLDLTLSSP